MRVLPLSLGTINVTEKPWPVHGFVVLHPSLGAVLVDTGCGGPESLLRDFRVVNRAVADALAEHDLTPADVSVVVNTHLHFDHCGQNPAFAQARLYVQRAEYERVQHEDGDVGQWLNEAGVAFELVDGESALADDLRLVPTPGHTSGHQCVVLQNADGAEIFVGDAAFTREIWQRRRREDAPALQAEDWTAWQRSLEALQAIEPRRVHFCHDE